MKIYKENKLEIEDFLIVSFFTQNYKDKADRLINSLNNFNLNYKIFEVPTIHYSKSDKGSNDINYCMPKLIIDMLKQFKIDLNAHSHKFYRLINVIPTLLLILIVFVVVFKPL